ncbi:MAG: hypothetical protein ACI4U2_05200 [Christensenellaceae bacterium]
MKRERKIRRRAFAQKLRDYVRFRKETKFFDEQYYTVREDGSVVIDVYTEGEAFSTYGKNDLEPSLTDYIEETTYYIPVDRPLVMRMHGVPEADREKFCSAYKKYYDLKFNDKNVDLKINLWKSIGLMSIGIAFLVMSFLFSNHLDEPILNEILAVVASFSMWESVDYILLERSSIRTERFNTAQLLLSDLEFVDEETT